MKQLVDLLLPTLARVPFGQANFVVIKDRHGRIFSTSSVAQDYKIYPVLENGDVSQKGISFPNLGLYVDIIDPTRLYDLPEVDAIQNPLRYALENNKRKYGQRSLNR